MKTFYKLALFLPIFILIIYAGFHIYKVMNRRIKESESGWSLLGYTVLYFLINAILFVGALFILIWGYSYLNN